MKTINLKDILSRLSQPKSSGDKGRRTGSEESHSAIQDAIRSQAREDERKNSSSLSLKTILAGDFFTAESVKRQIWLIFCIAFFIIFYVAMRYNIEQDMIRIDKLRSDLRNAKYRSLAASSQLTEQCRESNVLRLLAEGPDSMIHIANQPPYIISVEN